MEKCWSSGNLGEFLSFEPTELPNWRQNARDEPPISTMLEDIVKYKEQYEHLKKSNEIDSTKIYNELLANFWRWEW